MRSFQLKSLRMRLLFWLLIPSLGLWLVGSAITYWMAIKFANTAFDSSLEDVARAIASRLVIEKNGKLLLDLPPAALDLLQEDSLGHGSRYKLYYQVRRATGEVIAGDRAFLPPVGHPGTSLQFYDARLHHQNVRVGIFYPTLAHENVEGGIVIQVAETLKEQDALLNDIFMSVVLPELGLIFMSALFIWFGIERGLVSIDLVRQAVLKRRPKELTVLSEDESPTEIRPLVHALNDLLRQVALERDVQQRFMANATHHLRTPIAGLKTQAELALRQTQRTDPHFHALSQIHTSAQRINHLINQLLTLARHEYGTPRNIALLAVEQAVLHEQQRLNLSLLAKEVTQELVPQAIIREVDLGFEQQGHGFDLPGDALALRELMTNLIANALQATPSGSGKITVRLSRNGKGQVIFEVEDNGYGIPEAEKERVFERFYRSLPHRSEGSGLGLAIVKEIADHHGATVQFCELPHDTSGTLIQVVFPVS